MKKTLAGFCLLLSVVIASGITATASTKVKAGVYQNRPLVFYQDNTDFKGLYIDILEYIAGEEGWELEYVACKWSECLKKLKKGEVDLLTAVGYSEERAKKYAYTRETVVANWAQIYAREGTEIGSFPDLKDRTVAVLEEDIYYRPFRELLRLFDVNSRLVFLKSYDDILRTVSEGRVDAGVVNRLYGGLNEGRFHVVKTPVIFSPIDVKIAFPKKGPLTPMLRSTIDGYLRRLKEDPNSVYYQSINRWFGGFTGPLFPAYLKWVFLSGAVLLLLVLLMSCLLRKQVRAKTGELALKYEEMRKYTGDLEGFIRISREITTTTDLKTLYRKITTASKKLLGLDFSTLMVLSEDGKSLVIRDTIGFPESVVDAFMLEEGQGLSTYVIKNKVPGKVLDFRTEHRFEVPPVVFERKITSSLCVPMLVEDRVFGVLIGHTCKRRDFTDNEVSYYQSIANQAAVAINNAMHMEELRQSETRTRALIDIIPDIIFRIRDDGTFIEYKASSAMPYYAEPGVFSGRNITEVMPGDVAGMAMKKIEEALQKKKQQSFEYRLTVGEEIRHYEARVVPYGGNEVVVVVRDFTERKHMDNELRRYRDTLEELVDERTEELHKRIEEVEQLNRGMMNLFEDLQAAYNKSERLARELKESNEDLESFAYSVSHDLRAPLRAMQGFAGVLLEDYAEGFDEQGRDYTVRIVEAAYRLDNLIQDLLAYSRISRREIKLQQVSLRWMVEEVLKTLTDSVVETGARIDVSPELPDVRVSQSVLFQVLINLLSNAMKFTKKDMPPEVIVRTEERNGIVRLFVEDRGIGIPGEHRDRIFRVFERLHGIETYPGTGIGLAIVKKGVERMGGAVGVESKSGGGSRFWIDLLKWSQ